MMGTGRIKAVSVRLAARFPGVSFRKALRGVSIVALLAAAGALQPALAEAENGSPAVLVPLPPDVEAIVAQSLKPENPAPVEPAAEAPASTALPTPGGDAEIAVAIPLPPDMTADIAEAFRAEAESSTRQAASGLPAEGAPAVAPGIGIVLNLPPLPEVVVSFDAPRAGAIEPLRLETDAESLKAMLEPLRARYRLNAAQVEGLVATYAARDFRAIWLDASGDNIRISDKAATLIAVLSSAEEDGLDAARLLSALPMQRKGVAPRDKQAEIDLRLSLAAFLYAHDARGGRTEPARISAMLTPQLTLPQPDEVIGRLATAESRAIEGVLHGYQPPHAGYRALRKALGKLREDIAAPVLTGSIAGMADAPLPSGDLPLNWLDGAPLVFDKPDPRVAPLRLRLGLPANGGNVYDAETREAVIRFQRANDLTPNARITPKTRAALENPRAPLTEADRRPDRQAQLAAILANMERWRWLPPELGEMHVFVNVADFRLNLVQKDAVIHETRVIVGKPQTQTPIFSDEIEHLIVNPSWHVPPSILKKEFLPALAKDPKYAAKRGYEVVRRGKSISIRQPPGERNALGHVKFIFPNQHSVYLHDTPSRNLFSAETRAFSHGCVRVDKPFAFAEKLIAADLGMSEAQLRAMVGRGERMLKLNRKIPVHLAYFTVFVDQNGEVQHRRDLYGHDARLASALQF